MSKDRSYLAILIALSLASATVAQSASASPDGGTAGAGGVAQRELISLRFTDTDASDVLMAVARAFRANIVLPADLKKPVSLKLAVRTVEEALNGVAAAAGFAWRRIGTTYVIAQPTDLKQAVATVGDRTDIRLKILSPTEVASILDPILPYLTVRPVGATDVLLIGSSDDIGQARVLIDQQEQSRSVEQSDTAIVPLQFVESGQVASAAKSLFPKVTASPVGSPDQPGGVITFSGPASQVQGARDLVRQLDVRPPSKEADRVYRVYAIRYSSAPMLVDFLKTAAPEVLAVPGPESYSPPMPHFAPLSGASLGGSTGTNGSSGSSGGFGGGTSGTSGSGVSGGAAGGSGQTELPRKPGDRAKAVVLSGRSDDVETALRLLEQVDVPSKQVLIEVKVVDTSPEQSQNLGLQWTFGSFNFNEAPAGTAVSTIGQTTRPLGFGAFSRVPWTANAALNALLTNSESKLLASPRMQVTDNDDANIFIGNTVNVEVSQSGIAGTTIQVESFPVDIVLLVRPRVNADGKITMRVHPVVSVITSVDADGLPQTSSREAETTVMVKDGETMVIGGLISDEVTKTVSEVPILSKLPIVGELFKNRQTDHKHSEILVFITPHIVQ